MRYLLLSELPDDFRGFAEEWMGYDPWVWPTRVPWVATNPWWHTQGMPDRGSAAASFDFIPLDVTAAQLLVIAYLVDGLRTKQEHVISDLTPMVLGEPAHERGIWTEFRPCVDRKDEYPEGYWFLGWGWGLHRFFFEIPAGTPRPEAIRLAALEVLS